MSLSKRMMEAGYRFSDKLVCADCFDDYAIKAFIRASLTGEECSFCGQEDGEANIAAEGNAVIDFILSGIHSEYSTVNQENPIWDPEENEYAVPTYSISDLVHSEHPDISSRPEVLKWIVDSIGFDDIWCDPDPAILSPTQGLIAGWRDFCDAVKHKLGSCSLNPSHAATQRSGRTRIMFIRPRCLKNWRLLSIRSV